MSDIFYEEGDHCPNIFCKGYIALPPVENCTCFINPPCSACVNNDFECDQCGWSNEDEIFTFTEAFQGIDFFFINFQEGP